MSVKVTGEGACGPGGGGVPLVSAEPYERPVRCGVGVGCCAKMRGALVKDIAVSRRIGRKVFMKLIRSF